jgi:hypothetical protein
MKDLGILDEHWEAYEVTSDATHRFLWMWHGYNIRVIGVPKDEEQAMGYDWAWCYPKDPELVVEALRWWIPELQDEPPGWHKRPTSYVRQAPERVRDPYYNRPRCIHGRYIEEGCRTIDCPGIRE